MPVITQDLNDISLAESVTGWVGNSGQLDAEVFKEGANAYTWAVRKNTLDVVTFTPAANINMTANYTTPHLYWTMRCDVFPFCEALNTSTTNSGLMVRVTDGSGNYTQWHVAGSDTWDGGWQNFVLDLTNTANIHTSSGTLSLTDVDIISWYVDNSNSGNIRVIDNTWMDAVRYGDGLTAWSTTTEAFSFQDIADDDGLTANYYGVLNDVDGVLFCQGGLILGDAGDTNDTNFVSTGETIYFKDRIVDAGHYKITAVEATAATNPTDIDISALVCKTVGSTGAEFDFSDADLNSFSISASTLIDMGALLFATGTVNTTIFNGCGATTLSGSVAVTDSTWTVCSLVTHTSSGTLSGCVFDNAAGAVALKVSDLGKISDCVFNSDSTGHGIEVNPTGAGPFTYTFNDVTFNSYAGTDGSTGNEAILINPVTSSADITINVGGTGNLPTIMEAAGYTGTVTVSLTKTLTLTDIPSGVNVTIVNSSTRTELQHSTSTGVDITYGHSGGETVDILLMANDYDPNASDIYSLTLPSADSTIKFSMTDDPNYSNPA